MFDFESMPKYEICKKFWFVPISEEVVEINVKATGLRVNCNMEGGRLVIDNYLLDAFSENDLTAEDLTILEEDWEHFRWRPEYQMLLRSFDAFDDSKDRYETMFVGSALVTEYKNTANPDKMLNKLKKCLEWLEGTDFFICPASTQYHDSCPGGLLEHSLAVADRTLSLLESSSFKGIVNLEDAIFASLVHDWCKIGLYLPYMKNIKDDVTGQWDKVPAYKYAEDRTICLGHGVSSLYMVTKFFNVSMEVALAIRWHMGRWNVVDAEINELQQANRNYPLVHLIQFADQLSIVNY